MLISATDKHMCNSIEFGALYYLVMYKKLPVYTEPMQSLKQMGSYVRNRTGSVNIGQNM